MVLLTGCYLPSLSQTGKKLPILIFLNQPLTSSLTSLIIFYLDQCGLCFPILKYKRARLIQMKYNVWNLSACQIVSSVYNYTIISVHNLAIQQFFRYCWRWQIREHFSFLERWKWIIQKLLWLVLPLSLE